MKKYFYLFISLLFFLFGCISCSESNPENPKEPTNKPEPLPEEEKEDENLQWETAQEAVKNMQIGWNLGNTLDSNGDWIEKWGDGSTASFETAWGQPVTSPELIQMFADAGFGAIRVPVTWYQHMDKTTHEVDQKWMNRVEEVVNYVLDAGMYCILNVHHDTGTEGWLRADLNTYQETSDKFKALWEQIAERFADYDHHLLFEAYNEILDTNNTWNLPSVAGVHQAANALNQDFVDVIRVSGGNNRMRNLVVCTYAAATEADNLKGFSIPQDITPNHLIAEVHSYAPYPFAFDLSEDEYWSKYDTDIFNTSAESEVQNIVNTVGRHFTQASIPCILGEFGAHDKGNESERAKQAACYVSAAAQHGICCFYWMGLVDGEDRKDLKWTAPFIRDAILEAATEMK